MAVDAGATAFLARHRPTGQVLLSRAPAIHAEDAVRYLAQRRAVEADEACPRCREHSE